MEAGDQWSKKDISTPFVNYEDMKTSHKEKEVAKF